MKKIADAGLLIGFLDRLDKHHKWAVGIFEREAPPFYSAEPVLAEVAAVVGNADDVLSMVETGDVVLSLDLAAEVSAVRGLVVKYRDHPMDLGDACCVRLAELLPGSVVYTVDRTDFSTYRKNGRQPVPCVFPD
jgi:predicted nucleic acid-binding protein